MTRRAQAALEYLVTYGWALLAILVAVGAFAYFGLFDIQKYLPERCDFGAQLQCVDFQIRPDNGVDPAVGFVRLRLRNNFGEDINVTGAWITGTGKAGIQWIKSNGEPYPPSSGHEGPFVIAVGNYSDIQLNFGPEYPHPDYFTPGERATIPITFEFKRNLPTAPQHNVSGSLFATVLARNS